MLAQLYQDGEPRLFDGTGGHQPSSPSATPRLPQTISNPTLYRGPLTLNNVYHSHASEFRAILFIVEYAAQISKLDDEITS